MTSLDEDFVVIGLNDLDKEGKKTMIKSTVQNKITTAMDSKTYQILERLSEAFAQELGFNNSNYQYVIDAMELREFRKHMEKYVIDKQN
jgi:hypothetical protein